MKLPKLVPPPSTSVLNILKTRTKIFLDIILWQSEIWNVPPTSFVRIRPRRQLFGMGNLNFTQIKFCARRKTRNFLSLSVPRRAAHYRVKWTYDSKVSNGASCERAGPESSQIPAQTSCFRRAPSSFLLYFRYKSHYTAFRAQVLFNKQHFRLRDFCYKLRFNNRTHTCGSNVVVYWHTTRMFIKGKRHAFRKLSSQIEIPDVSPLLAQDLLPAKWYFPDFEYERVNRINPATRAVISDKNGGSSPPDSPQPPPNITPERIQHTFAPEWEYSCKSETSLETLPLAEHRNKHWYVGTRAVR